MSDLNTEISLAFDAMPIILVFITIFFGIIYPQIQTELKKIVIDKDKKEDFKNDLKNCVIFKSVPLILIILSTFCLCIPLLRRIFTESLPSLLNLDFAPLSLVFIAVLIFIFLIWSVALAIQLLLKRRNLGKEQKSGITLKPKKDDK